MKKTGSWIFEKICSVSKFMLPKGTYYKINLPLSETLFFSKCSEKLPLKMEWEDLEKIKLFSKLNQFFSEISWVKSTFFGKIIS